MRINRNISFPYPVLGHRRGIASTADATIEGKIQDDYYVWNIKIVHDNDDIDKLVLSGKVRYACEIDCPDTYYRNTFFPEITSNPRNIQVKIKRTELGGRVNVVVTALAVEKIQDYHNSKSSGLYANFNFELEPGDIVAIFGEWNIDLDIEANSYKRITSIIQIQLQDSQEVEIDLNDKKSIIIGLPKDKYRQHYDKLVNPFFQPALLSSIVFEAICRALQHLSDHEDNTWARILENKIEHDYGYDDIKDELREDKDLAFELTRKILDDPYSQLLNLLDDIAGKGNEGQE